jgi:hypothetical protein
MINQISEIEGEVQKKTENSIKVENIWIKFFDKKLIEKVNIKDLVRIEYKDNIKDEKTYHNGQNILTLEKALIKESKEIPRETVNTLIMGMVNLYNDPKNTSNIEECAKIIVNGYKEIKELI